MKSKIKLMAVALCITMVFVLSACVAGTNDGSGDTGGEVSADDNTQGTNDTDSSSGAADGKKIKIGVIQYAPHPSLDNCYKGFIEGLASAGYKDGDNVEIYFQNAQGEQTNSDMIAKNMVVSKYDMIVAIATPAAMSAYSAAKDSDIPIVFSAVSDPLAAGIVESLEKPGTNATGTSDVLPLEDQMKMIRAFLPDAKKIGIIYTTSEPNSVAHLTKFKEIAPEYGFEIVDIGVTNSSEVATAATTLVSKGVEAINNFTDNNVVNNLPSVIHAADAANIPVFGSEVEQVKNGCVAAQSIDYVSLGRKTGEIAAKILKGEAKAGDIPVALISDSTPVYNKAVVDRLKLTVPPDYANAEEVGE
ncbi:MAG: putative tryptophan/tyrosine transport system substrate-binding protein [Clostridiales bacterium]|nr:putative tryptophan/tyrosine transport system substrate-binding protein [Clostridiales bacterium]